MLFNIIKKERKMVPPPVIECLFDHPYYSIAYNIRNNIAPLPTKYIKQCKHMRHTLPRNAALVFPVELILLIREQITTISTLHHFDRAFGIEPCKKLYCTRFSEETYFDTHWDHHSITDVEYNKRHFVGLGVNQRAYSYVCEPSYYQIERTSNGFCLIVLKAAPPGRRIGAGPVTDPVYGIADWSAVNMFHAYDMPTMRHDLEVPKERILEMDSTMVKKYKAIQKWFGQKHTQKCSSPYYCAEGVNRWIKRGGRVWVYPTMTSATVKSNFIPTEPDSDWVQTIYDVAKYQRGHSPILNLDHANVYDHFLLR